MNTLFQLWTPANTVARTIVGPRAALNLLRKSPAGWFLEEFDAMETSRGVIRATDADAMRRLVRMAQSDPTSAKAGN